jgi:primosomal replication protein N
MANLNKVLLMGNLTRDPEVRYTPKGTAVGDLAIAINDSYKAQDGTIKETVTYVDIEVWGRQAETCKQYLTKGRPVFIEGQLKLDQWETPQGGCVCARTGCNFWAAVPAARAAAAAAAIIVPPVVGNGRRRKRVRPGPRRRPAPMTGLPCPTTTIFLFKRQNLRIALLLPPCLLIPHSTGLRRLLSWATTPNRSIPRWEPSSWN